MLVDYINAALRRAQYKMHEDDSTFFGSIPELEGVWANGETLEACRDELQDVLEGWILLSVKRDLPIPDLDGVRLELQYAEESA